MARKESKFDFCMFKYVLDVDNSIAKIYRNNEDITKAAMNSPLFNLLVAYDTMADELNEKEKENQALRKKISELENKLSWLKSPESMGR